MNKALLLVEDNASDEKLTIRAFNKSNLANEIIVVRDGEEALEYMFGTGRFADREVNDLPAVVLLDLKLPRVDGLEVLRQIRADERTKLVPIIILTSSKEDEDRAKGYSLGANAYVRKPVAFSEFTDAIRTLGLFWLVLNEPPPMNRGA
ncbi:MAG TPA: response regulator [Polyangiaceae bacterium]|nr:response regulator [Polyangiaceae bacterium]